MADLTPPDIFGPTEAPPSLPWETPPPPPFVFTDVRPIIPPKVITPVTPPDIGPGPRPIQIVFPSAGTVAPPAKYAAAPAGWLDQQMIAGVPNSYLALATAGLVLFVSMAGGKRRR